MGLDFYDYGCMAMKRTINMVVNGEKWRTEVASNDVLLDVLRNQLGIKSPKVACERGDCGACTVLLNGKTVRSCLVLAVEADGCEITTLEGLSKDGLTPLQEAFVGKNAFQCGFCAPGMILSATELLENNPNPTEEEVKEAIAGNLCRCTGYQPIIDTILEFSQEGK
jgi:carbon-monoxide dehydrogenase small subunit